MDDVKNLDDNTLVSLLIDLTVTIERNRMAMAASVSCPDAYNALADNINHCTEERSKYKQEVRRRMSLRRPTINKKVAHEDSVAG